MNKADANLQELLWEIEHKGVWSKNPRTKWEGGTPANYKSVYNKTYTYDISKGEFPINTLRTTPFRGCFEEIRWIYQLQSNIIEDAHLSIRPWWEDFKTETRLRDTSGALFSTDLLQTLKGSFPKVDFSKEFQEVNSIGATYGEVIRRYDLMNKLLHNLEHNPESRRNIINLWDNQCQEEDPKALPPCAFMTKWVVRGTSYHNENFKSGNPYALDETAIFPDCDFKYVDLTLSQRSRDSLMVFSINPLEYVMLQMMVCGHLTWKTGVLHKPGILTHHVEDEHVYDRNYWALDELLEKKSTGLQPKVELICEPKNFYDYRWEDFKVTGTEGITPLSKKLQIAI